MNEDAPAIIYARFVRWLREGIRREVRAELARRSAEPMRLVMPFHPHGAPPLFHLSDEDCGWQLDQIERGQINRN